MHDLTYREATEKAKHLKALGRTGIYLRESDPDLPWSSAIFVEPGSSYRLGGPASAWVIAEEGGLTFKWTVDFEVANANGRGVALFDRDRLREVIRRLPPQARASFAAMLDRLVLPELKRRTAELRQALNQQADSEDCVCGLIAFGEAAAKGGGEAEG